MFRSGSNRAHACPLNPLFSLLRLVPGTFHATLVCRWNLMLKDKILMIFYSFYFWPQNCYLQGDGKCFCAAFRRLFLVPTEIPMVPVQLLIWSSLSQFLLLIRSEPYTHPKFVDIEDSSNLIASLRCLNELCCSTSKVLQHRG